MSLQTEYAGKEAIASIQTNFPELTLIYDYNEDFVVYKNGSAFVPSTSYVEKDKFHKSKTRFSNDEKGYYFLVDGRRYFLNEAIVHNY